MKGYQHRYILSVAEHRSLSKAAETLFVSQPYLSKLIASIEEELGVQIFDRSHSPLTITAAGECYLAFIRERLYSEQKLKTQINNISAHRFGDLTIGIPQTHGSYVLPNILRRFQKMYPGVRVIVEEQSNRVLMDHLSNGTLDLCYLSLPEYPEEFGYEVVKQEHILLVLPPEHPLGTRWSKGNFLKPVPFRMELIKMLQDEQFVILTESQGIGKYARMFFEKYGIRPKIFMETRNIETAYRLAAAGVGVTFIPTICTRFSSFEDQPHYFSISEPPLMRSTAVVYLKNRMLSQTEWDFIQIARESA